MVFGGGGGGVVPPPEISGATKGMTMNDQMLVFIRRCDIKFFFDIMVYS